MNNTFKRFFSLLTAFSFAFATLIIPVSANLYFPPGWPWSTLESCDFNPRITRAYIDQYRTEHPDSTYLDAYNSFRNSDTNGHHGGGGVGGYRDDPEHGGGGVGGHRDSNDIDRLFHYNEVTKYADDFHGTQEGNTYISYDGVVSIVCEEAETSTGRHEFRYLLYVNGVNPLANKSNPYIHKELCANDTDGVHKNYCSWYVQGSTIYTRVCQFANLPNGKGGTTWTLCGVLHSFDFSQYVINVGGSAATDVHNYYTVTDNSGQSWNYDPVYNQYSNNEGDIYPYIDIDLTQFPEDDFNKFMDELKNLDYNDAFQFLTLYDMLQQILSTLQDIDPGVEIDLSKIKIDIPLNDYTSLLQAIQACLLVMSNNLSNLATHSDCVELINLLNNFYKESVYDTQHLEHICSDLKDILSRLDVIIELQDIVITSDIIDNITESDLVTISTYITLIVELISKYPLTIVQSAIDTSNSVIFHSSAPSDITINYNGNSYVFLSSDFANLYSSYLEIARGFVSVIILYAWLLYMRKKIVDTI